MFANFIIGGQMKVAIVFQSPYGQTKKIAQQIKQNLVFESQFKDNVHLADGFSEN